MGTIKSYTDKDQARELAKILPLDTADMSWVYQKDRWVGEPDYRECPEFEKATDRRDIPCWSLAALLRVIPFLSLDSSVDNHYRIYTNQMFSDWHDNPVDTCYEMILKLNEENLL